MSRHAKRLTASRRLKIPRKEHKFIVKPSPGPHNQEDSIPLLVVIRDMLELAKNAREAKRIIKAGEVLVDGRVRKDHKFPVGLMDLLEIPKAGIKKIVVFDKRGRLILKDIENAEVKLYKIRNKTTLKGGNLQLNLHDGSNLLIPVKDPRNPEEDVFKTKDTLVVRLRDKKIQQHLRYREGSLAYITGGSHTGELARIKQIKKVRSPMPNEVVLESLDTGESFETIEDYVFVVGEQELALPQEVFS